MNDFAHKNYNDIHNFPVLPPLPKHGVVAKIKLALFVALCFGTFAGILATTMEVGHSLQMERIAQHAE